jgi:hypothetical protein
MKGRQASQFRCIGLAVGLLKFATPAADAFQPSGDADIDRARKEILSAPTNAASYRERSLLMFLWLAALQQQGADTHGFFDTDKQYYRLETAVLNRQGAARDEALQEMGRVIDAGFAVLEEIQRKLNADGPIFRPFTADPAIAPTGGDMDADWPMFQANIHNTGFTTAPGPRSGKLAWKNPVGLGWYARPLVEDGKVYVASPGMRATAFCLDLETGKDIWKSTQTHPLFGIYKYPAIMSTPVALDDRIAHCARINDTGGPARKKLK